MRRFHIDRKHRKRVRDSARRDIVLRHFLLQGNVKFKLKLLNLIELTTFHRVYISFFRCNILPAFLPQSPPPPFRLLLLLLTRLLVKCLKSSNSFLKQIYKTSSDFRSTNRGSGVGGWKGGDKIHAKKVNSKKTHTLFNFQIPEIFGGGITQFLSFFFFDTFKLWPILKPVSYLFFFDPKQINDISFELNFPRMLFTSDLFKDYGIPSLSRDVLI